jgi:mutator family transposase
MTTKMIDVEPAGGPAQPDLSALAEQLVATARTQGVELTGPGGLLTGLTRQVLETALGTELGEHLGHERGVRSGSGNVRNGSSQKTVRTMSARSESMCLAIGPRRLPRRWCLSTPVD